MSHKFEMEVVDGDETFTLTARTLTAPEFVKVGDLDSDPGKAIRFIFETAVDADFGDVSFPVAAKVSDFIIEMSGDASKISVAKKS